MIEKCETVFHYIGWHWLMMVPSVGQVVPLVAFLTVLDTYGYCMYCIVFLYFMY